ncbi:hypothetical protein Dimus_030831, partial [Dionaea muscipula]
ELLGRYIRRWVNGEAHNEGSAFGIGGVDSGEPPGPSEGRLLIGLGQNSGHPAEFSREKTVTVLGDPTSTTSSSACSGELRTLPFLRRNRDGSKQMRLAKKSKLSDAIERGRGHLYFSSRMNKEVVDYDRGRRMTKAKVINLVAGSLASSIIHQKSLTMVEVEKVWQLGKVLGLYYEGEEREVISRLSKLEEEDGRGPGHIGVGEVVSLRRHNLLKMLLLSWNIRGVGRKEKWSKIKEVARKHRVDFLLL